MRSKFYPAHRQRGFLPQRVENERQHRIIIKSHIRGGFRSAADYLKEQGKNEKTRLVEISDAHAQNLDDAFRAMWAIADGTRVKKPLHHISINPMKDERLTDEQVRRICERLEERYGYAHGEHQRVIVEHVKDGRQHFHVIWNRVSLGTGRPHYPYMHKKQSKIVAREMEIELGLKKPQSRRRPIPRTFVRGLFRPISRQVFRPMPKVFRPPSITPRAIPRSSNSPPIYVSRGIPTKASGMCEAQRIDFKAACEGKITWKQYFDKWGDNLNATIEPR